VDVGDKINPFLILFKIETCYDADPEG